MMRHFVPVIFLALHVMEPQGLAGRNEYQDAVDAVSRQLEEIKGPGTAVLCPSSSLVLSCGNSRCETRKGENEENCPADCFDSLVKSYDDSMACAHVQRLFQPNTIAQVQELVRYAANANVGIRIIGNRHTINNQYCTDGIVVSTVRFNKILGIEKESDGSESVWVEPGVVLGDLAEWLHKRNRTLGYAQLGFRLATVGGAIATGAHGSSALHNSIISNIVRAVTLIDGTGTIHDISDAWGETDELRAVRAHLGNLGAVVRIKLKIMPQFRLRVKVSEGNESALLRNGGIFRQVGTCDYALINWFPNTGKFIRTCAVETKDRVENGAENSLLSLPVPSFFENPYRVALHYGMCYQPINAALEGLRYLQLKYIPPFKHADIFGYTTSTRETVGYSHRIMTSALANGQSKFFVNDWEIAVPFSRAQEALRFVSDYARLTGMRMPLIGLFLRFAPSDDATLLAHTTSVGAYRKREPVVFIEFPTPVPVGFPHVMTENINSIYEELARILITRYGGRSHWGKNKAFTFSLQNEMNTYDNNLERFRNVRDAFDPQGLFLTAFDLNAGF